jgi:riboflavin synthase
MFTGIITDIGTIRETHPIRNGSDHRLVIDTSPGFLTNQAVVLGASIACSGVCLTVVAFCDRWFAVEASAETLSKTTLGDWEPGTQVNLERSLRLGDELGGHFVSGHVDATGEVVSATPENSSVHWRFRAPTSLARFIAPKGSIAVDGVSLTAIDVDGATFGVNIILHTASVTTFGKLKPGSRVNLEIDMMARYVARQREFNL